MKGIIKVNGRAVVIFDNGSCCEKDVSDELYDRIRTAKTDDEAYALMNPDLASEKEEMECLTDGVSHSKLLVKKCDSIYWEEVSQLSLPTEFVISVIKAERDGDEGKIDAYRNFWTLMSLNPDERCRKNLFWFLSKNGLVISRCGFFVAYRNADIKSQDGDDIVYTDSHTHTFDIRIGEMVSMPRKDCDPVQENTCSMGLHLGASWWLKKGLFGTEGLVCLCNPADVVSVPPRDDYGKLRTCAYLPVMKAEFDEAGKVIPVKMKDGFDCGLVTKVIYEGLQGSHETNPYTIEIPDIGGVNKESVSDRLLDIAMRCVADREVMTELTA